jgi:hypothetical protein
MEYLQHLGAGISVVGVLVIVYGVAAVYAGCGLIVAVLFLAFWCKPFDPSAKDGTWGFRVFIVPGIIALWPVILAKVLTVRSGGSAQGPAETPVRQETSRRNHGLAFIALAILGPLLFAVAFVWRAPRLEDAPPVRLNPALEAR